jgi:signal peptidase I
VTGQLLGDGFGVRFRVAGTSMEPAIGDGDLITVAPVPPAEIQPGDVVYYAAGRRTIAHRVVEIRSAGSPAVTFIVRGDARAECDAPVAAGQILGKVIAVERARRPAWSAWRRRVRSLLFVVTRRGGRPQPAGAAAHHTPRV